MSASPTSIRYHGLDALRAVLMLLVVLGHSVLPYVRVMAWFRDPATSVFWEVILIWGYGFVLPAFFLTAGFSAGILRERLGPRRMLVNRARRILVPLLIALPIVSSTTSAAMTFAQGVAANGSLSGGIEAFERGRGVRWDMAYHLWFLIALLAFYVISLSFDRALAWFPEERRRATAEWTRRALTSRWRPLIVTVVVACLLVPVEIVSSERVMGLLGQLILFAFFALGWLMYVFEDLRESMRRNGWWQMALGIAVTPPVVWATWKVPPMTGDGDSLAIAGAIARAVAASFLTLGIVGICLSKLSRPSAALRYLSDASYWIYFIHLPIAVMIGGVLALTSVSVVLKPPIVCGASVLFVLLIYHLAVGRTRPRRSLETG